MENNEFGSKESNVKSTIDAVTGLANAIPIYNDLAQPSVIEIGKSLETITKTINIALAPIAALVWGYEKIKEFIQNRIAEKLKNVPIENIVTPDPSIVCPALEALRFVGENPTLSELYANLIANSMDKETIRKAHPGFVEMIKNMTADEGLIIRNFIPNIFKPIIDVSIQTIKGGGNHNFINNYSKIGEESGCKYSDFTPKYLDNLCRLGLLHIPAGRLLAEEHSYDVLTEDAEYKKIKKQIREQGLELIETRKYIELTEFGIQFKEACVNEK
jgi:hypothetical protein